MSLQTAARLGAQRPEWSRVPDRISSAGAEAIDLARAAGLHLDDWQQWVLDKSLGERDDGTWSAFEVGLIVGRQNGKNAILEARELAGVVLFGDDLIVHTAHRADTTMEHFRRMEQYADEFDEFKRLVKRVSRKNGDESIELKDHRRIKFVCRARNPGRGFSGSCIVFDEALESLEAGVIGAMIPTLATRQMAQVWYTSSAPKAHSDFLHGVRRRGRGDSDEPRLFFAEWGNDDDADPYDMDAIARANPGLGIRISEEFVDDERRLMSETPAEFARERLGIPEEPLANEASRPIPLAAWDALADPAAVATSAMSLGLCVSPDRSWSTLGIAGLTADGRLAVGWLVHEAGTAWIVDRVHTEWLERKVAVRIHSQGPEKSFIQPLRDRGVEVVEVSTSDLAQSTGQIIDAVSAPTLVHTGQPSMRKAVDGAVLRVSGDGAATWSQLKSSVEITPLQSVTVAAGGVFNATVEAGFTNLSDFLDDDEE